MRVSLTIHIDVHTRIRSRSYTRIELIRKVRGYPIFFSWRAYKNPIRRHIVHKNKGTDKIATPKKFVAFGCFHHFMQHTKNRQKSAPEVPPEIEGKNIKKRPKNLQKIDKK